MALSVLVADIQARANVHDSAYETEIDEVVARLLPVVSYALRPEALASGDAGLQAVLDDGAADVIAGTFLAQHYRRPELLLSVIVGDLQLFPRRFESVADPSGLIAQGWLKLKPWLKPDSTAPVLAASGKGVPS
ncbi:MAG: hypothetical protein JNK63_03540 [Chthonomonas sp.]|nr:hypothetical protein [Chthonomonas sp.]